MFVIGTAAKASDAPLTVNVRWPDGRGIAAVDVEVGFDSGDVVTDYTQEYGWSLSADEARKPRWIKLGVPMHRLESQRFAVDTTKANALAFTLIPNDLGVPDFANIVIEMLPGRLSFDRDGGHLSYVK